MSYRNDHYRKVQKEINIKELLNEEEEDFNKAVMELKETWKINQNKYQPKYQLENYLEDCLRSLRKPSQYQAEELEKMAQAASLMLGSSKKEAKRVAKNFSSNAICKSNQEEEKKENERW